MKRSLLVICCLVNLMATSGLAGDGGAQSPFALGAGARDLALGGSGLATADPVTAPYWNPSCLAQAEQLSFGAFHTSLYESDVAYQYLGIAIPTMDLGGFGIGLFRLGIGGIDKRSPANVSLGEIDDSRLALYAAYGRTLSGYDVGFSVMLEHHSLDDRSATSSPGLSLAASRRFRPDLWWLPEAAACINGRNLLKPGIKLVDETVKQPYSFDAGISIRLVPRQTWNHTCTVSGAVAKTDLREAVLSIGVEYNISDMIHLRTGLRDNKASFGVGLSHHSITFGYALADRDLGNIHMFNIKADIGLPVSEKRLARAERREAEFNSLISTRLADRNREMVSNLVTRGRQSATDGDLEQASVILDRALFLAEGSGLDTTDLYALAKDTKRSLEIMQRDQAFEADMSSARDKLAEGDYLGARYFADLALARVPDSREARQLTGRIDTAMELSMSRDQMVESRLVMADSLVSYGKFKEALIAVSSIDGIAPDDGRARMIVKKAEFGNLQDTAEAALGRGDYRSATAALDRALELFPSHPWCLSLKARIDEETRPVDVPRPVPEREAEPLSEEIAGQVDQIYRSGQRLFEEGNLQRAVERWERVERLAPGYLSVRRYLVDAYKFLGVELYTKNDLEEAVVVWKKAADLEPDNTEIANYIKRTEAEITRLEELSYEYR